MALAVTASKSTSSQIQTAFVFSGGVYNVLHTGRVSMGVPASEANGGTEGCHRTRMAFGWMRRLPEVVIAPLCRQPCHPSATRAITTLMPNIMRLDYLSLIMTSARWAEGPRGLESCLATLISLPA